EHDENRMSCQPSSRRGLSKWEPGTPEVQLRLCQDPPAARAAASPMIRVTDNHLIHPQRARRLHILRTLNTPRIAVRSVETVYLEGFTTTRGTGGKARAADFC